jgi:hypothetical protein
MRDPTYRELQINLANVAAERDALVVERDAATTRADDLAQRLEDAGKKLVKIDALTLLNYNAVYDLVADIREALR